MSIVDIVTSFGISPATARRDINKLDLLGKLKKVRNGAQYLAVRDTTWPSIKVSNTACFDEKLKIAKHASCLCTPESTVVINCGTTAFTLGKELCGSTVQIVTNYFPLASYLIDNEHENVMIIGGQYNKKQHIFIKPSSSDANIYGSDLMFTSGKGLTEEGLYKTEILSAVAEQQMLKQVNKLIVMVDSSKVGHKTGMMFCPATDIDTIITGKDANPDVIENLKLKNINIILI